MSGCDTCIFCLEGTDHNQQLMHNVKCRCNFCFHTHCYDKYDRKTICPICRMNVGELFAVVTVLPQPRLSTPAQVIQVSRTAVINERTPIRIDSITPPSIRKIINALFMLFVVIIMIIVIRAIAVSLED